MAKGESFCNYQKKNKQKCNRVASLVVQRRRHHSLKRLFALITGERRRQKWLAVLSKLVLITQLIAISTRQLQSGSSSWNDAELEIDDYVQNSSSLPILYKKHIV